MSSDDKHTEYKQSCTAFSELCACKNVISPSLDMQYQSLLLCKLKYDPTTGPVTQDWWGIPWFSYPDQLDALADNVVREVVGDKQIVLEMIDKVATTLDPSTPKDLHFDVIFDAPPGPQSGHFIEVEHEGRSIRKLTRSVVGT